jgi:hypothetical protein
LAEVFRGNKDLFKGLYIYDKIEWEEYPVIRLDMSNVISTKDEGSFNQSILNMLNIIGKEYNVRIEDPIDYVDAFRKLILLLSKINKVVILIDEYDKPILDNLTNYEISNRNRNLLREFYSVLKSYDQYIKFCLLTGVSKFSKVSVFSGLNNLKDITLNERFSTICGLTQEEVDKYFEDRMGWISEKLKLTKEELREKIKEWYNGYSWDGEKRVYNPFSILNFYEDGQFNNYWFSTGTPTFLIERAKIDKVNIEEIENKRVGIEIFESFDITNIDFISLLFQTGYLTITSLDVSRGICVLNYPNKEVRKSFLIHIASRYLNTEVTNVRPLYNDMLDMLRNGKIEEMIKIIKSMISKIPYQLHIPSEAYYHSMFYIIFDLMGIEMDMEVSTIKGRIDGVIEFNDKIYIIEFKYLSENKEVESVLNNAIKQIKTKEYYIPYTNKNKPIKYLAIGVNREVVEYKIEE